MAAGLNAFRGTLEWGAMPLRAMYTERKGMKLTKLINQAACEQGRNYQGYKGLQGVTNQRAPTNGFPFVYCYKHGGSN
jgi:hypothetical protein